SSSRRRRPRQEGTTARNSNNSELGAAASRESRGSVGGVNCESGRAGGKPGAARGAGVAREGGGGGCSNEGRSGDGGSGSGGGGGGGGPRAVERILAVGFKSGECAVLDATAINSPSFLSVLNTGGAHCEGRVTAVRFVPGAGRHLFVAAFSTGDAYTFDTKLGKEAPMGAAAEKDSPATVRVSNGGGGSGGGAAEGVAGAGGGATTGHRRRRAAVLLRRRPCRPPSPVVATLRATVAAAAVEEEEEEEERTAAVAAQDPGAAAGRQKDGFFVEMNMVAGANPVSRWRVASDGREITDMAFAPCEVDGRRLVALSALDGAVRVVDYDKQALDAGFKSWFGGILCLDWSPDGRYIVTGGEDDAVTLWCLETRTCVMRGEGHSSWVTGVAFDHWTSRQPYYRFTSVGEDARLCMWEHDEMAGSLLHGASGGRLRRVPSPNLQHRYKSSENLSRTSKSSSESLVGRRNSGSGCGGVDGGGGPVATVEGATAAAATATMEGQGSSAPVGVASPSRNDEDTAQATISLPPDETFRSDNTWPRRSKNLLSSRLGRGGAAAAAAAHGSAPTLAPETHQQQQQQQQPVTASGAGSGGVGRGSPSLPSRGMLFFGG
ncbi:unnamed protein product, partial [Pylaiella littoralis]